MYPHSPDFQNIPRHIFHNDPQRYYQRMVDHKPQGFQDPNIYYDHYIDTLKKEQLNCVRIELNLIIDMKYRSNNKKNSVLITRARCEMPRFPFIPARISCNPFFNVSKSEMTVVGLLRNQRSFSSSNSTSTKSCSCSTVTPSTTWIYTKLMR